MDDTTACETLAEKVAALDESGVMALVELRLRKGDDLLSIIEECEQGMRLVGEAYERNAYYLAGLIMAGEIFRQVVELVEPHMGQALTRPTCGRVLIGTVQGDIHDVGKDLVALALRCFGFEVEDLGVDVPPRAFLERALADPPDIIGLSSLLTSSFGVLRETVQLLRMETTPQVQNIPIVIGGGLVNEDVRSYVGADYWCSNGFEGVRLCQQIVQGHEVIQRSHTSADHTQN